jgi:hypothetical protein
LTDRKAIKDKKTSPRMISLERTTDILIFGLQYSHEGYPRCKTLQVGAQICFANIVVQVKYGVKEAAIAALLVSSSLDRKNDCQVGFIPTP